MSVSGFNFQKLFPLFSASIWQTPVQVGVGFLCLIVENQTSLVACRVGGGF